VKTPTVSIILPTYNRLQYLPDTIASIIAQTLDDWELIITDDGSDAATRTHLQTYSDHPRIRFVSLLHTGRPAVVRNTALRKARGQYIAFMDSDDIWMPTKLAAQIRAVQSDSANAWCHTQFDLVDAQGNRRQMKAADGRILNQLLDAKTVIALPSVVVSRQLLDRVGGFDESLTMCEDYDLWLRLAARTQIVAIHESLTIVRRHGEHYGNPRIALGDGLRVLEKALTSNLAADSTQLARRAHATYSAMLAKHHASSGLRLESLALLLKSVPTAWRYHAWWRIAFDAVVLASVPRRARRLHWRHRTRTASNNFQ
jgi:glycosyltransferase involved in cell wall biosynthesis